MRESFAGVAPLAVGSGSLALAKNVDTADEVDAVVEVAVAAGATQQAPSIVVATAGPATINAQPGGVGSTTPAQNLSFSVGLNVIGVTAPITVTGVNVINGSQVQQGQALLSLDPAPLEQNVASVQALLTKAKAFLAIAEGSTSSSSPSS